MYMFAPFLYTRESERFTRCDLFIRHQVCRLSRDSASRLVSLSSETRLLCRTDFVVPSVVFLYILLADHFRSKELMPRPLCFKHVEPVHRGASTLVVLLK